MPNNPPAVYYQIRKVGRGSNKPPLIRRNRRTYWRVIHIDGKTRTLKNSRPSIGAVLV